MKETVVKINKSNKYVEMKEEKGKKEQICKVKQRQIKKIYIYIKDQLQGEKNSRKNKQRNKCRKNNNRFKKLKLKKRKGKLHRTAKAQCRGRGL